VKTAIRLIIILAPLIMSLARAQENLTLEQAVEIALAHNAEVMAAQYALDALTGRRLQSVARPEPYLAVSTEGVPFSLKSADTTEINLSLQQPIEFPGKRPLRAKIGRYGEDIASLELERVRLIVASQVKKAYWKAVLFERTAAFLEGMAGRLDEIIESSLIRYQAGTAAYSDVLRIRIEKARLQNEKIETRRQQAAALSELALLLGRGVGDSLILTTEMVMVPIDRTLEEIKASARASRPSLRIAALRAEQATAAAELANKNRLPDFSVGLFLPSIRFNAWGIGLGLSLPISKARTEGERLEAKALLSAALAAAQAQARRLDMLLEAGYNAVRAAGDQVRLFEQKLLVEIEEELRSGLTQYQYGKIESYSLLDLYRTYGAARVERLKALSLYLLALADLEAVAEEG